MAEDDDSENIDRSEWIKPKDIKGYVEAPARRGSKTYNNGSIITADSALPTIDWLHEVAGILDGKQHDIGNTFKNLCDCAEGKLVAAAHPEEIPGNRIEANLKKTAIYYQLTPRQTRNVEMVLFEEVNLHNRKRLFDIAINLQDAFEALWNAFKAENIEKALYDLRKKEIDKNSQLAKMLNVSRGITAF